MTSDGEPDLSPSPLEKLLGGPFTSMTEEEFQVVRAEINLKIEEDKQRCMTERGWEYELFPLEEVERLAGTPVGVDGSGYGFSESVEFGLWFNDEELLEEATANQPNVAYVESLTSTEQEQWSEAEASCNEMAVRSNQPERTKVASSDAGFDLEEQLDLLERDIANDPRLAEAWLDWSRCMASEGFDFQNRDAIFDELDSDFIEFDELISAGVTELPLDLQLQLKTFTDKEMTIKLADETCSVPVDEVERFVRFDLEEAFIQRYGLVEDT